MSLVRQNSCFQPTIDALMHGGANSYMSKIDVPDLDNVFYTIPLDEEPMFTPLTRGTTVSEAETNTAEIEYWLKALMLAELDDLHAKQAKQAKQLQWADTLVQAVLTYSKSEYDRRGPHEIEWTRMPCSEYEPDDYIDEMAGCGISEFSEEDEEQNKQNTRLDATETSNTLLSELMKFYG
jgi:hypothetical protein